MMRPFQPKGLRMKRYGLLVVTCLFIAFAQGCDSSSSAKPASTSQTEFVFCHWNVENFFDDKNDGRNGKGEKEYDALYANRPELLKQKLAKLPEAILNINGGKGPE